MMPRIFPSLKSEAFDSCVFSHSVDRKIPGEVFPSTEPLIADTNWFRFIISPAEN